MSKIKLALILDKSKSYTDFQKEKLLAEWEVASSDLKNVSNISEAGGSTLFGKAPTALLTVDDPNGIKDLVKSLTEISDSNNIENIVGEGIIIMSAANRNSTKKLESLIEKLGGQVIVAKASSKDKTSTGEKVINDLNFTREVKDYILSYVGDDYEALIPIARSLSEIPKESHKKITIEDIFIRLPKAPGAVPPWEIERPLFAGDLTKTIEIFRRIHKNSDLLVVLFILKNKVTLAYRCSSILENAPRTPSSDIAETLGVADNYPLKLAMGYHTKYGYEKVQKLTHLLAETERKVKGGSAAPSDVTMEMMIVEFQRILRS